MSTAEQVTVAVRRLPKDELARFRRWFAKYDAAEWDRDFQRDVVSGRLDALAREARQDFRAGRTTDL